MLDVFLVALESLLTGQHLLYMALGVMLGLAVGIFPGLGGIAGLSMLIPFLYGLDTVSALAMLIGLVAVIPTSDTFTSVLMGIPGSSASQATILDGFPLAKKGEAARALAAAFSASLIGGIIGAVLLTFFVLIARPLILAFGSAELFMLAVLGLSMVGVLSGSSLAKGLSACGLGLLVGSIGAAPATGEIRMVFGVDYLWDGLPLVIVGLGIFAFPEIVDLLRQERAIARSAQLGAGWLTGLRDTFRHWFICLRCSGLGAVIGAIPGLGGSVVDWIAYGHVVQTSRDKSRFGSGDIRGVLAPESANNAKEGGGLMPTLLFGIPGSGSMAIFLGGMVLLGIQPGPMMVSVNLDLTYTIIWSLALANVIGAGLCLVLAQPIAHLTTIRFALLAPFMIMVISFAAFQATRDLNDLLFLFAVGVLGVFLKRFGWPRPAFLIGFVLAGQAETYLYQAVQFYGWNFLTRPGVVVIALITLVSVWLGSRSRVGETGLVTKPAAGQAVPPSEPRSVPERRLQPVDLRDRLPQIAFAAAVFAFFTYAFQHAYQKSFLGGIFPLIVSGAMLVFGAYLLWQLVYGRPGGPSDFDQEHREPFADRPTRDLWLNIAWFAALFVGTALFGFILALTTFFVVFLRVRAGVSWLRVVVLTAGGLAVILVLGHFLVLDFPRGLLQDSIDLPWPLR